MEGWADTGFGAVADEFAANFTARGDLGAAVALYVDGRPVVDLWAGVADAGTGRRWDTGTVALVFSTAKGIVALCAAKLADEGLIDLDAPVNRYWPEFGKEDITVRCVLSHRAGLPVVDRALTYEELLAWTPVVHALAEQVPLWTPGTAHAYHTLTYGWLAGEVIRRVTGRMPGGYLRDAFAKPLGLSTWIGFPHEQRYRLAPLEPALHPVGGGWTPADGIAVRAMTMNGALPLWGADSVEVFNDPALLAAELPGVNAVTTARDLAKLYAAAVSDVAGFQRLSPATLADVTRPLSSGAQWPENDPSEGGLTWATGFLLHTPSAPLMLGPRSFGHGGANGSMGFADDEYRVGFGYVTNRMGGVPDERASSLIAAVRQCLHLHSRHH